MNTIDGKLRTHCDTNRQNVCFFAKSSDQRERVTRPVR